ncbi:hypothetical protein QCI43_16345 [Bacillus cereus group sp. MG21]|nr:MAG: hypothetical protein NRZ50_00515 [Bacillus paranthracis]WAI36566.1 MAG: hypothetical protein NRZ51_18080 [Bacillus paranthracis]
MNHVSDMIHMSTTSHAAQRSFASQNQHISFAEQPLLTTGSPNLVILLSAFNIFLPPIL